VLLTDLGEQPAKTVVLVALGEGSKPGVAPTTADFRQWRDERTWAWHALDPGFTGLKELTQSAVPIVVLLDARTMEISFLKVGAMTPAQIEAEVKAIRERGPSY
jgi:hypothetical protein